MKKIGMMLTACVVMLPVLPNTAQANTSYTVRNGDTLWGIGRTYNVTVQQLMSLNQMNSTVLQAGQVLKLAGTLPALPVSPPPAASQYTVQAGDTLWGISRKLSVSVSDLQRWNTLTTSALTVGQKLSVSGGGASQPQQGTYTVRAGDTLYKLSQQYGVSVQAIMSQNRLNSTVLTVGQVLQFNGGGAVPPPAPAPQPAREAIVTASSLLVRQTPAGTQVGALPYGARVVTGETNGDWTYITYGGLKGWAHKSYLQNADGTPNPSAPAPSNGRIVVLDPGHGGADPGAVNGSHYEKTYTLLYANKVKWYLEKKGYRVYLTRSTDTSCYVPYSLNNDLACRVQKGADYNAGIFVSIHFNSLTNPGVRKTETYYNARSDYDGNMNPHPTDSKRLAESIHRNYQPAFGSGDGGVINNNLYVNRMSKMPAVLLEVGYLSSPSDLSRITNSQTQERVTSAIAQGIDQYFR